MIDIFGTEIKAGDSFLRIENVMGGANLRYYFFAGYVDDTKQRVKVQEYGGKPRVINTPCTHTNKLYKLTNENIGAKNLIIPRLVVVLEALEGKS